MKLFVTFITFLVSASFVTVASAATFGESKIFQAMSQWSWDDGTADYNDAFPSMREDIAWSHTIGTNKVYVYAKDVSKPENRFEKKCRVMTEGCKAIRVDLQRDMRTFLRRTRTVIGRTKAKIEDRYGAGGGDFFRVVTFYEGTTRIVLQASYPVPNNILDAHCGLSESILECMQSNLGTLTKDPINAYIQKLGDDDAAEFFADFDEFVRKMARP